MNKLGMPVLILSFVVIAGCTPVIHNLQVNDTDNDGVYEHDEPLAVQADITVKSGGAGTPTVSIRPQTPTGEAFVEVGELPNRTLIGTVDGYDQYRYNGEIAGLDYGSYDLRLRVSYSAWLTRQYVGADTALLIEPPDYCFGFDQGIAGFSLGPVRKSNGEELPATVTLGTKLLNWPVEAPGHISISFDITTDAFPSPPQENDFWFIDFISPELSAINAWQQSQGMTFRMTTRGTNLYAQPVVYIQGQAEPFAPMDVDSGKFLLYPIGGSSSNSLEWKVINWHSTPDLPAGTRQQIRIRLYGDARATALNNDVTVYLDGVCPLPPGISPPGGTLVTPVLHPWQ